MALSYYHLIPESVYGITSACTRRTYNFKTSIAEFSYRAISSQLFSGYNLVKYNNKCFKIACIEKAILDYFYINSHLNKKGDFESLRINKGLFFKQVIQEKLYEFTERFAKKTLTRRIKSFWEFMNDA